MCSELTKLIFNFSKCICFYEENKNCFEIQISHNTVSTTNMTVYHQYLESISKNDSTYLSTALK